MSTRKPMSDDTRWLIRLGLILIAASVVLHLVHYLIFRDAHYMLFYMVGDLAFIPIDVLVVTLILSRLLARREKAALMEKLNMVIGAFYSELGRPLIEVLVAFDAEIGALRRILAVDHSWDAARFAAARKELAAQPHHMDAARCDLARLRDFLDTRRDFTLSLLANPNLLEHESFTGVLWSVLHLQEELAARASLENLPAADLRHLSGDIQRAYNAVLTEWVNYLEHLKNAYPYLYSLAVRQNPLLPGTTVEVTG